MPLGEEIIVARLYKLCPFKAAASLPLLARVDRESVAKCVALPFIACCARSVAFRFRLAWNSSGMIECTVRESMEVVDALITALDFAQPQSVL